MDFERDSEQEEIDPTQVFEHVAFGSYFTFVGQ